MDSGLISVSCHEGSREGTVKSSILLAQVNKRDLRGYAEGKKETDESHKVVEELFKMGTVIWSESYMNNGAEKELTGLVDLGKRGVVYLSTDSEALLLYELYTPNREVALKLAKEIESKVPEQSQAKEDDRVKVHFWYQGGTRVKRYTRRIEGQVWDDIKENYTPAIQDGFEKLVAMDRPDRKGRIVFWHGEPGVGKTWAIRALLLAWKNKASLGVITDPAAFFASMSYMNDVLLDDDDEGYRQSSVGEDVDEDKFKVFILEDAADLLIDGCREQNGFARFLNITDGLIGQGLKCLFLITANEELGRIDPAVVRAGRCLQRMEFMKLGVDQSNEWLKKKGVDETVEEDAVLADLYRMSADGSEPLTIEGKVEKVGFAPNVPRATPPVSHRAEKMLREVFGTNSLPDATPKKRRR